jgi:hypothetical protein
MVDQGKPISELPIKTKATVATDRVVFIYNAANTAAQYAATMTLQDLLLVPKQADPANGTSIMVKAGSLFCSNNYLYYAVADDKLKRVALSDF